MHEKLRIFSMLGIILLGIPRICLNLEAFTNIGCIWTEYNKYELYTIKLIKGKVLKVIRIKGELPEYERNFVKEI